ncbi:MAG: quinone oxidoreductase family protein [Jatrophihabitans sp.]
MTPTTNRSVVVTAAGERDVLAVQDLPIPEPGPGQLLVRVSASGVNFKDVYERQGVYQVATPFVLGSEGAGTVESAGADAAGFEPGEVVAWADARGSHADYVLVEAQKAVPVPDGVSAELAAAAMLQGMTAQYLVSSTYTVQSGDAALVHAAAGGVGQLLVQMIKNRGGRVIATTSTDVKAAKARAAGADEVIDYSQITESGALAAAVREANGGAGVQVVYDGVGKATFDASLASLEPRGMMVLFGGSSGQVPPFEIQRLNSGGSLFLTRPTLVHYTRTRDELLWRAGDVLGAIADGSLQLEIGGRYPIEDVVQAYDDLENRRTTGKLVIGR